jgi:hypothetical protein
MRRALTLVLLLALGLGASITSWRPGWQAGGLVITTAEGD